MALKCHIKVDISHKVNILDIAILKVIYSELTAVYTIRVLLNEKEFVQEDISVIELEVFEKEKLLDSFV